MNVGIRTATLALCLLCGPYMYCVPKGVNLVKKAQEKSSKVTVTDHTGTT
jgi:hypothetical protein